jgi:hypothetical protein
MKKQHLNKSKEVESYEATPIFQLTLFNLIFYCYIFNFKPRQVLVKVKELNFLGKHYRVSIKLWGSNFVECITKNPIKNTIFLLTPNTIYHGITTFTSVKRISFGLVVP